MSPRPFDRVTGSYTGTGAAQTITLGFRPTFLWINNETDGDTCGFYIDGMPADTAQTIVLATAKVASQGITLSNTGFSLGTDAALNENTKVFRYVAFI
jgi:hypothetical protein